MQRLYDFLRRHPTGVDTFWAVILLGLSAAWIVGETVVGGDEGPLIASIPISLALSTVVALRRRAPEKMLLLTIAAGLVQITTDVDPYVGDFAALVIIYTVATSSAAWASRLALIGGLCAAPIVSAAFPGKDYGVAETLVSAVFQAIPFALAWVIGDSLRTRRAYYAQLEERAARLQRERESQAKAAVAAERARIARELHDVVAHNVSVMVVQADGAAYVLDASPQQAKQALETISTTGRQALAEMRRLLGLLRAGDDAGGEYIPQPGVDQLADLIEQVRGAGLPVRFDVEGDPRPLSSGVELTAYRIVQEALTNTRKHGGTEASATVRLAFGEAELDLLVEDDGRGAPQEQSEEGGEDGLGHGLIGMRERIGMIGGTLATGSRPGGGFRVSAVLPLKPAR